MKSDRKERRWERFIRMAEACTVKIISKVRLLGSCSNRGAYEYSGKDVNKIFTAVEGTVADAKKWYKNSGNAASEVFTLS